MNAHIGTPEYAAGYAAYAAGTPCPYKAGTTAHMLWREGWNDADYDAKRKAAANAQPT